MAKSRSVFICTNCGLNILNGWDNVKGVKKWNTLVEETQTKSKPDPRAWSGDNASSRPLKIDEVEHTTVQRFPFATKSFQEYWVVVVLYRIS